MQLKLPASGVQVGEKVVPLLDCMGTQRKSVG